MLVNWVERQRRASQKAELESVSFEHENQESRHFPKRVKAGKSSVVLRKGQRRKVKGHNAVKWRWEIMFDTSWKSTSTIKRVGSVTYMKDQTSILNNSMERQINSLNIHITGSWMRFRQTSMEQQLCDRYHRKRWGFGTYWGVTQRPCSNWGGLLIGSSQESDEQFQWSAREDTNTERGWRKRRL